MEATVKRSLECRARGPCQKEARSDWHGTVLSSTVGKRQGGEALPDRGGQSGQGHKTVKDLTGAGTDACAWEACRDAGP